MSDAADIAIYLIPMLYYLLSLFPSLIFHISRFVFENRMMNRNPIIAVADIFEEKQNRQEKKPIRLVSSAAAFLTWMYKYFQYGRAAADRANT